MRLAALILCLAPTFAAAESIFDRQTAALLQEGLTVTADEFVLPAYTAQAAASADLVAALAAYCGAEGDAAAAKAHFAALFRAWQRASLIQMGPVMEAEGPFRVQLWPDPKGFSRRAILAALNAADPALLQPDGLQGRSIALVNLTALEDLIYDHMAPGTYACDLALAVARFQSGLARDLVAAWQPGSDDRRAFGTAALGNARYASVDDLIREFLSGLVVGIDRVRKFKILRGLGTEPGDTHPERTEAVASGLGLAAIAESFDALHSLYELPDGFFDVTPEAGGPMEYIMLGETAANIGAFLSVQSDSLATIAAEDGDMAAELRRYGDLLMFHEDYLKSGLPAALGLTAGFTAADGD